ncbi:succinate dehydrogenase subunit D [Nitrosomonas sp. PY1]|uniref:succinate dehydrogenase, hydrophobic membrane anchor protein n=1 Tax=Nitrosomonas sp. PY1 TaxID=1803906 RepID=UPI001FC845BC|nr:succinate dehydrogenase, hydrophobic membrane anchor protein [Nitrosomonas sp. PY1]GKS68030.1 succinate dehydrogenase subunit D [Nitrosomonas sp. PY1]
MVKQSKLAVTGAHYGLKDWLIQRVTAVLMVSYLVSMIIVILTTGPYHDYTAWKNLFNQQWIRFATLIFFICLFWHAWIGLRNVLMDYIHVTAVRLTLQILVIVSLLFYTVWAANILWNTGN